MENFLWPLWYEHCSNEFQFDYKRIRRTEFLDIRTRTIYARHNMITGREKSLHSIHMFFPYNSPKIYYANHYKSNL